MKCQHYLVVARCVQTEFGIRIECQCTGCGKKGWKQLNKQAAVDDFIKKHGRPEDIMNENDFLRIHGF